MSEAKTSETKTSETKIDVEAFRTKLKEHEAELLASLGQSEQDARDATSAEVEDAVDLANSGEEKDLQLEIGSREYSELTMVQDALKRIDAGTYGKCTVCGRDIELKRLEAVPWTPYCIQDARARDPKVETPTL